MVNERHQQFLKRKGYLANASKEEKTNVYNTTKQRGIAKYFNTHHDTYDSERHPDDAKVLRTMADNAFEKIYKAKMAKKEAKKNATITAVSILALFGMYLMSLQMSDTTTGYATCLDNGNVLIGGIALIVIILLFVLVSTRKMGREVIKHVPMKTTKRKVSSKRRNN